MRAYIAIAAGWSYKAGVTKLELHCDSKISYHPFSKSKAMQQFTDGAPTPYGLLIGPIPGSPLLCKAVAETI